MIAERMGISTDIIRAFLNYRMKRDGVDHLLPDELRNLPRRIFVALIAAGIIG
jgi:hypothetical protein